ncbi:unnamed protein product, partial [Rotaria socialis]
NANGNIHEYLNVLKIVKTIREYAKKWAKQNKFCDFWYGNNHATKLEKVSKKLAIPYNIPKGNLKGLLVGVFELTSKPQVMETFINGVKMAYHSLKNVGIPEDTIVTLPDIVSNEWSTKENILFHLKRLLSGNDNKFFYFTGRRQRIKEQSINTRGYFFDCQGNSILDQELFSIFKHSDFTGHLTIVVDYCKSGTLSKLKPGDFQQFKVIIYFSCEENQVPMASSRKAILIGAFSWELFNALYKNPQLSISQLIDNIELAKSTKRFPYNQDFVINANYNYDLDEKIWK